MITRPALPLALLATVSLAACDGEPTGLEDHASEPSPRLSTTAHPTMGGEGEGIIFSDHVVTGIAVLDPESGMLCTGNFEPPADINDFVHVNRHGRFFLRLESHQAGFVVYRPDPDAPTAPGFPFSPVYVGSGQVTVTISSYDATAPFAALNSASLEGTAELASLTDGSTARAVCRWQFARGQTVYQDVMIN